MSPRFQVYFGKNINLILIALVSFYPLSLMYDAVLERDISQVDIAEDEVNFSEIESLPSGLGDSVSITSGDDVLDRKGKSRIEDSSYKEADWSPEQIASLYSVLEIIRDLDQEEVNALSDEIFDSGFLEEYERIAAQRYEQVDTPQSEIALRANKLVVEEIWGEAINKTGLSAIEAHNVRDRIRDAFALNSELRELRSAGAVTMEEYWDSFVTDGEIVQMLIPIVGLEKAALLEGHYLESSSNREPDFETIAMQRDSVNFPVFDAVRSGDSVAVESLLAAGADVNAVSEYLPDRSLLETGVMYGDMQTIRALLAYGADLEVRDEWGGTLLHQALSRAEPEILELLLAAGADPQARNANGLTPAMVLRLRKDRLESGVYSQMEGLLGVPK